MGNGKRSVTNCSRTDQHPKPHCSVAPYLITYCLFLWKGTSKSFRACAYESSDGPLLGSAVRKKLEKRGGGERGAIEYCDVYLPP